ncbi:MAG TPA: ArsR family transcriptional regulator [Ktedonobacterales bacterium]
MTDHTTYPDYELDDALELTTLEHFKAISDPTRQKILGMLGQQALTTKQLSEMLEQPKGTIGHHLKVLEGAGLIHVVRTRPVRAIIEKYYGRVARHFRTSSDVLATLQSDPSATQPVLGMLLRQALGEMATTTDPDDPSTSLIFHARISASEVREFAKRLEALAEEFRQRAVPGEKVYGLVASIYLTNWPDLPPDVPNQE